MGIKRHDAAAVGVHLVEWGQPDGAGAVELCGERLGVEVELTGRHRLVRRPLGGCALPQSAVVAAGLIIVGDELRTLGRRLSGRVIGDDPEALEVVESGFQVIVEERQPVLHAGIAAAFRHGLIEGVLLGRRPEEGEIVLAEVADGVRRQRHLAHGVEIQRACLSRGSLACRIEGPDGLQGIPKEVEPDGFFRARHEDVENTAADGEFADLADGRHAVEAISLQPRCDIVHADDAAGAGGKGEALDNVRRRDLLQHGVDGHQYDRRMRLPGVRDQARECSKSPRGDIRARRDAVIGKAVPGRQRQDRNVGGDEAQHLFEVGHPLAVGDHIGDRLAGARELGEQQRFHAGRHIADGQRAGGRRNLLRIETCNHS